MKSKYDFRILVIDDNLEIHRDFIKVLTNTQQLSKVDELKKQIFGEQKVEGVLLPEFLIDTASQGQEGVAKIAAAIKEGNPYALAFVDIRMPPGWDGVETIKHIWKLDKSIQIVICTAYSDYSWEETVSQLGKSDNLLILKKPFDFIAVRQLACALTRKWQLLQEAARYTSSLEQHVKDRTDTLQQSLSRLRATLESSTDGIVVVDQVGNVVDYNKKFITAWKIPEKMEDQKNFSLFLEHFSKEINDSENFLQEITGFSQESEKISLGVMRCKDGRIFEYYSQPQKLEQKTIGRVYSFRDITERAHLEEKLKYQASHDGLTGLPNRVLLEEILAKAITHSHRKKDHFAVLFFDLNRFKLINDSLSHAAGDELLCAVAKRLQKAIRSCDLVARLAGDEFVVVLKDIDDENTVKRLTHKLLSAINEPFNIAGREIIISTSIGVSLYPQDGKSADILLRNADAAMYQAKKSGTSQFQFYTETLNKENLDSLEKEMQLRHAITNNELFLFYQPQIDIRSEKVVAVEALIRWKHPKNGILLPIDFIPLAEETGLIVPIGEWVLRTACQQNKAWQNAGLPPIRVAVNITTQQLNQFNLVETIKSILQDTQLEPKYLELELTENSIISNVNVINTINILKGLGLHIALDDFGTGYSSLSYLKNIHLDRLKIDKSFVQNIFLNRGDEVIIQAIITMARSLNLEVLAEGVETERQLNFLKKQNCGEIQGFYSGKPLSAADLESILTGKENMANLFVKDI